MAWFAVAVAGFAAFWAWCIDYMTHKRIARLQDELNLWHERLRFIETELATVSREAGATMMRRAGIDFTLESNIKRLDALEQGTAMVADRVAFLEEANKSTKLAIYEPTGIQERIFAIEATLSRAGDAFARPTQPAGGDRNGNA